MSLIAPSHVENRRLFDAASGTAKLDVWEREHLHTCQVCQGVFFVFISQEIGSSGPPSNEPSAAA